MLAGEALSAAQHLLEKNGEFYPFAVVLAADGAPQLTAADPGDGEHPSSQAVLDMLYDGAQLEREGLGLRRSRLPWTRRRATRCAWRSSIGTAVRDRSPDALRDRA